MHSKRVTAYIALGSNLGDRPANLRAAIAALARDDSNVISVSSFIETDAVGGPADSPQFLNAAVKLETSLSPRDLLDCLLAIELSLGRIRRERWGPRVIDLDILLYGDRIINDPGLTIPHPQMHLRQFVLEPLAEVAPEAIHPVLKKTVAQLLGQLT